MGKLLFFVYAALGILALLFFPIYVEVDAHYDMNRRKFGFAVYAYKFLKVIGGYIATYTGGLALHVSEKKAILIPYSQIESERKRFSFVRTFRLKTLNFTAETGAEYLMLMAIVHAILRTYFFIKGGTKERIENNLWLTDGDVLRLSLNTLLYFNLFILLRNFLKYLKEKMLIYVRKK
jgi:hypothetical protein